MLLAPPLPRALAAAAAVAAAALGADAAGAAAAAASPLMRALVDSAGHGVLGAAVWVAAAWLALTPGTAPWEQRAAPPACCPPPTHDPEAQTAVAARDGGDSGGKLPTPAAAVASLLREASPRSALARGAPGVTAALLLTGAAAGGAACALDADHFVAAWSTSLAAATRLAHRPFGHAVAFVVAAVGAAGVGGGTPCPAVALAAALGSHQLRDGVRRGLWLWPLGSTPPLHAGVYAAALACLTTGCGAALRWAALRRAESGGGGAAGWRGAG